MDPVILCCAALPLIVIFIRKCRQLTWGWCDDQSVLTNKCFIVTGANSGIGKETVKALVKRKARVIMGCRDMEKAREVIRDIRRTVSTGELVPMELDLASLKSIKHFALEVIRDFPQIHVLINNAGVAMPALRECKTKDGFEINMGINHIGHFYLTKLLLQKLKDSAPSRIIIVTSKLHEKGEIDFENLLGEHGYDGVRNRNPAYNNSKLANVYFCRELAKRLPPEVETYAVCPGLCFTRLMRHAGIKWYQYIMLSPVALFFLRSAEQVKSVFKVKAKERRKAKVVGKKYDSLMVRTLPLDLPRRDAVAAFRVLTGHDYLQALLNKMGAKDIRPFHYATVGSWIENHLETCPAFANIIIIFIYPGTSAPKEQYIIEQKVAHGSQTVLHCALSNDVIGQSGKIFRDCKLYHSTHQFDNNIQEKLWRVTDRLINKYI